MAVLLKRKSFDLVPAKPARFDLAETVDQAVAQFRNLNPNDPGQWPPLPRYLTWAAVAVLALVGGWVWSLSDVRDELDAERRREPQLKEEFRRKLALAVNLNELRVQKLRVQEYVTQLERQLPGKAEMDALLSDINQAGLGRGLQFELFRPGSVVVKDYYAELPISIRVTGRYHDIGAFAADVANLSRIVTLHNMSLAGTKEPSGALVMEAVARTYRYLDQAEVEEQRKAAAATRPGVRR